MDLNTNPEPSWIVNSCFYIYSYIDLEITAGFKGEPEGETRPVAIYDLKGKLYNIDLSDRSDFVLVHMETQAGQG